MKIVLYNIVTNQNWVLSTFKWQQFSMSIWWLLLYRYLLIVFLSTRTTHTQAISLYLSMLRQQKVFVGKTKQHKKWMIWRSIGQMKVAFYCDTRKSIQFFLSPFKIVLFFRVVAQITHFIRKKNEAKKTIDDEGNMRKQNLILAWNIKLVEMKSGVCPMRSLYHSTPSLHCKPIQTPFVVRRLSNEV